MPLSAWVAEWYGGIDKEIESAVARSGKIELRCPPEKIGSGNGTWQKMREVKILNNKFTGLRLTLTVVTTQ